MELAVPSGSVQGAGSHVAYPLSVEEHNLVFSSSHNCTLADNNWFIELNTAREINKLKISKTINSINIFLEE